MSQHRTDPPGRSLNTIFNVLASQRRRRILSLVIERTAPVSTDDLAASLVDDAGEDRPHDGVSTERERVLVALTHVELPMLEDAGLIRWDRADGTVTATDHPALRVPTFSRPAGVDEPTWDAILDALANARRRIVLSVLSQAEGELDRRSLASRVAAREAATADGDGSEASVEGVLATLHHVHLPALQAAGLLTVEATGVGYEDHPAVPTAWFTPGSAEQPRSPLWPTCS